MYRKDHPDNAGGGEERQCPGTQGISPCIHGVTLLEVLNLTEDDPAADCLAGNTGLW
jgi:hypothetical protein